jgi:hypothetical protein
MTRGLGNTLVTALGQRQIHTAELVKIQILRSNYGYGGGTGTPEPYYFDYYQYTNAPVDITYATGSVDPVTFQNLNIFYAQSTFIGISSVEETADIRRGSMNIELSALDTTTLSSIINSRYLNSLVTIWRVVFDTDSYNFTNDKIFEIYKGRISGYAVQEDETTSTLNLEVASQFANFEQTYTPRTNPEFLLAGDLGFDYSDKIEKDIKWGR